MARKKLAKLGTPVTHKAHGNGVIVGSSEDPDGIWVRFEQINPKWGTDTWEVSSSLLTKRWGRAARTGKPEEPKADPPIPNPRDE